MPAILRWREKGKERERGRGPLLRCSRGSAHGPTATSCDAGRHSCGERADKPEGEFDKACSFIVRCGSSRTPLAFAVGFQIRPRALVLRSDSGDRPFGPTLYTLAGVALRGDLRPAPASTRRHQRPRCTIVQQVSNWHGKIPIDSRRASRAGTHRGRGFVHCRGRRHVT